MAHHTTDLIDLDRLRTHLAAQSAGWGGRVRHRRKALGLTQQQLADLLDVPVQTVSKVERGQIVPRDYLRAGLAIRLCVEIDELFPWPTRADLTRAAS